jgi:lipopolysaccharide export system permease protein
LRVPLLISRFLPFSVLLGALIAFAGLNQHSEVVSMKAAGLSAHQILARWWSPALAWRCSYLPLTSWSW